jgi:hypothetical protein
MITSIPAAEGASLIARAAGTVSLRKTLSIPVLPDASEPG